MITLWKILHQRRGLKQILDCFICQTKGPWDYKNYIKNPSIQATGKLITTSSECCRYGASEFESLNSRLHGASANELLKNGISYHKNCYKNFTHKYSVDSARARFDKGSSSGDATTVRKKKRGRPSACDSTIATCSIASQRNVYQKHKCVFCQEDTESELHDLSSENMGTQLKDKKQVMKY